MSEDCIFCRIVSGDIPGRVVYEDEKTIAFLDANPLAKGHTLIVPREHYGRMEDVPPEVAAALGETIARVSDAVVDAVDADGTTIAYNNGEAAGQEVPHLHGHVIPRVDGDGFGALHTLFSIQDIDEGELDDVEAAIADGL
jgi:histidine triad (HIT) family protein